MSGVLRLDQTAQLFYGGAEMAEAWAGGVRVWRTDPLAPYYGTGPGQIPTRLPFGDDDYRTWDATGVLTVQNRGGAGAAFNCSTLVGERPQRITDGIDFAPAPTDGATFRALRVANSLELVGVHFLLPVKWDGTQQYVCGTLSGAAVNIVPGTTGTARLRVENSGFTDTSAFSLAAGVWQLIEVRISAANTRVWVNGALVANSAIGKASVPVSMIGTGYGPRFAGQYRCKSQMGRELIAVIVSDQTTDYPAISAARALLAQAHGITIA